MESPKPAAETGIRNYHLWLVDLLAVPSFRLRMSRQTGSDLLRGPSGLLCCKIFLKAKKRQSWKSIPGLARAISKNRQRQRAVLFAPWGSQGECSDSPPLWVCRCHFNITCGLQAHAYGCRQKCPIPGQNLCLNVFFPVPTFHTVKWNSVVT